MVLTLALNIMFPLVSQAATVNEQLMAVAAQNNRLQELLKLKSDLEQGNKQSLVNAVLKNALAKSGTTNDIANVVTSSGDVKTIAQAAVAGQAQKVLSEYLAPYQDQLNALNALLNLKANLTPAAVQNNNSLTGAPQNYSRVLDMTATAYGPGPLDNGKWNNATYLGGTVRKGVAAVDPSVIPMGSKLWIEGYGEAIAEDQGSAIKGNRIDLAFNTRQEALDFGIQNKKIYILN